MRRPRTMSLLHIHTPRLLLRPFVPEDAPVVARFYRDPDVIRFMKAPRATEEEVAEAIRSHTLHAYEALGFGALAGILKESGEIVGRYGLQQTSVDGSDEIEISWLTDPACRRRGFASEAVRGLLDAAWREGMDRVVALIMPENLGSQRLAENAGFRFERELTHKDLAMRLYAARSDGTGS